MSQGSLGMAQTTAWPAEDPLMITRQEKTRKDGSRQGTEREMEELKSQGDGMYFKMMESRGRSNCLRTETLELISSLGSKAQLCHF